MNDRPVDELVDRLGERVGDHNLRHLEQVRRAHHIGDKKIVVSVAVDVGEVHRHREVAAMAQCQLVDELEFAVALIDPKPVRRLKIVANINVRPAVLVDIADHHRQAQIPKRLPDRLAVFVEPIAVRPVDVGEVAATVVEVEKIRLADFDHVAAHDADAVGVPAGDHLLAIDRAHRHRTARAQDGGLAVVGDVNVEVAVAVHVAHRDRRRADLPHLDAGGLGAIRKPAGAVVDEERVRPAAGGDEQIEITVAVHVAERRAGARHTRRTDPRPSRDVFELPVTEVFEKPVVAVEAAQIEVAQSVAVHVTGGDARSIEQVGVDHSRAGQPVGEPDAGGLGREQREAGRLAKRPVHPGLAVVASIVPLQRLGQAAKVHGQ